MIYYFLKTITTIIHVLRAKGFHTGRGKPHRNLPTVHFIESEHSCVVKDLKDHRTMGSQHSQGWKGP